MKIYKSYLDLEFIPSASHTIPAVFCLIILIVRFYPIFNNGASD